MINHKKNKLFKVDEWTVEPVTLRLIRGGEVVKLEPKVMNVLVLLIENRGEVVTRDELVSTVWQGRVVGYDAVSNTIIKLRKAFGDDSRSPRLIETISKKGYRFIANVEVIPGQNYSNDSNNKHIDIKFTYRKPVQIAAFSLLILLGIFFLFNNALDLNGVNDTTIPQVNYQPLENRRSIAVIPFDNLDNDPDQDYFSDGITEDLITDLSKISGLFVVARNSVFAYKGIDANDSIIGQELGVDYILKGKVQKSRDRIRLNVRLIDVNSGNNIWAERYNRELTDIFQIQDELAAHIVSALEVELAPADRKRLARNYIVSIDAYEEFLRGLDYWGRRSYEDNELAKKHFQKAILLDPGFARAYAGLALAYAWGTVDGWERQGSQSLQKASLYADKAIQLDTSIPQVYFVKGQIELFKRNYDEAVRHAEHAITIKPSFADAYALLGWTLHFAGRPDEGLFNMERASRLNPRIPSVYRLIRGALHYSQGDLDKAVEEYEIGYEINPNYQQLNVWLAAAYAAKGRIDEAEWIIDEIKMFNPGFNSTHVEQAFAIRDPIYMERFLNDLKKAGLD